MRTKLGMLLLALFVVLPCLAQDSIPLETVDSVTINDVISENAEDIIPNQGFGIDSLWRGILGMAVLLLISFLFSANRRAINWKTVGIGLSLQLVIAIGVLKVPFIQSGFEAVGEVFISILGYTRAGSKFLFEGLVVDTNTFGYIFAFQVLPTIIFFSALTSLLFYLGIIQKVVKGMAWLLSKSLGISGPESLSVAGNIFLGQTEAPLLIKAYLEKMNKSEILLVMIGGMATVAGAVLAAYIGFLGGEDKVLQLVFAKHLLAASVMAAPGAIVISKILYPQTEAVNTDVAVSSKKIGSNILDAIANGTTEGLKLAVNVGAMLLVFVAMIAMAVPLSVSRSGIIATTSAMLVLMGVWSVRRRVQVAVSGGFAVVAFGAAIPGLLGTIRGLFTNIGQDTSIDARTADYEIAYDFIEEAVARAAQRLDPYPHVDVSNGLFPQDWPDGSGDLIVLSEVGYYLTQEGLADAARGVERWLEPGGTLVACHYSGATNYPRQGPEVAAWLDEITCLSSRSLLHDERFDLGVWTRTGGESPDAAGGPDGLSPRG